MAGPFEHSPRNESAVRNHDPHIGLKALKLCERSLQIAGLLHAKAQAKRRSFDRGRQHPQAATLGPIRLGDARKHVMTASHKLLKTSNGEGRRPEKDRSHHEAMKPLL
jgi:hypothetical protein